MQKFSTKGIVYRLHSKQNFPISLEEAWDLVGPMYPGQIIQYLVTPVFNIKTHWVTEITHVKHQHYFVDEQRFGPYTMWHHKHFIKEIPGGVEMEDIIDYKIPLGFLGRLVHPIIVKPKLKEIFEYRTQKLTELFGTYEG